MTPTRTYCNRLLRETLVRPFYRKNAGQLVFIFILFFGAVGELEGSQVHTGPMYQLHYQYALILGMLSNRSLFLLVLLAWFFYAEKCAQFVISALQKEDHKFLDMLNRLSPRESLSLMYKVQMWLYLPISVYSIAIVAVALYNRDYLSAVWIEMFIFLVCLLSALRARYQLQHPGKRSLVLIPIFLRPKKTTVYWRIFIEYLFRQQKLMLAGIKLFSCAALIISIRTVTAGWYDLRMPAMLYGIGIFGHAILIYHLRSMEEKLLLFYRGMPVRLSLRFAQYAILYLVLFIPETIALVLLTPAPLHPGDAITFFLSGYGLLMLMNSLLFVAPMTIKDLLKILLSLYLLMYFAVLAGCLLWLGVAALTAACIIFGLSYYRYDRTEGQAA